MKRLFLIIVLCLLSTASVFAQDDRMDELGMCGHDASALYAAIEADGWFIKDLIQFRWSPTCRYLSMRLPSHHGKPGTTIVWDATVNMRVGTLDGFAVDGHVMGSWWDPRGEYLVVPGSGNGTHLWHVPTNNIMQINSFDCGLIDTYWDYDNGVVYATSPISLSAWCSVFVNRGGLRVYDLHTGEVVHQYPIDGYTLAYEFSADGRYIILTSDPGGKAPVQIIDRYSGALLKVVNIGSVAHSSAQIELSPDGRYLAIGMLMIRVWDLSTLTEDLDEHEPIYRYEGPLAYIRELHFVDNQTVETTTRDGIQRWDLLTGMEIP